MRRQLQAGYFIDEIHNGLIKSGANFDTLKHIEETFSLFELEGIPEEKIENSLLAVAHKILTRGFPTRASLTTSEYILESHLSNYYHGYQHETQNTVEKKFQINNEIFNKLGLFKLSEKEFDFLDLSEQDLFNKLQAEPNEIKLLKLMHDLNLIAKIQVALILFVNSSIDNESDIILIQFENKKAIASKSIEDLNCLFSHLNNLSESNKKLPMFKLSDEMGATFRIEGNIEKNRGYGITIYPNSKIKSDRNSHRFYTTKRIKYPNLLKEDSTETYKEQSYFDENKKEALQYFLHNIFRKKDFYPGQEAIINSALQGHDVIGLLPTGGGKSLTYQLCSLLQPGLTIIIDPINSLMKDQYDKLVENGISNCSYYNSLIKDRDEKKKIIRAFGAGKYLFFFISPERLQMELFRNSISKLISHYYHFSYAVIDEAHCVSEWGHDFRFPYLNLGKNIRTWCKYQEDPAFFGLTATASFDVLSDVQRELDITSEDAIISLPPEAIDREELQFKIIDVGFTNHEIENISLENHFREKKMGMYKYPLVEQFITKTVIENIYTREVQNGFRISTDTFFKKINGEYESGGVIFCPTKSDKLGNGVIALANGYLVDAKNFCPGIKERLGAKVTTGTFISVSSGDGVENKEVAKVAANSEVNQVAFLKNKQNLMICTKAFGMGIDKPNIRYSLHYSFPSSIESLYQEAGRAGRNRQPALCGVLYHPKDEIMNIDFVENGFKGIQREQQALDELLTEIQYEDEFFIKYIQSKLSKEFSDFKTLYPIEKDEKLRYLKLYGEFKEKKVDKIIFGKIDLDLGYHIWPEFQNVDKIYAQSMCKRCIEIIKKEVGNESPSTWLKRKSVEGIESKLKGKTGSTSLLVGFNNSVSNELVTLLSLNNPGININVINDAYDFSRDAKEFIKSLEYNYWKNWHNLKGPKGVTNKLCINEDQTKVIVEKFPFIRKASITQRAVYRLISLGIIDDYTIDYANSYFEIFFSLKEEDEYKNKFRDYLRKYLGEGKTEEWIKRAEEKNNLSSIRKYLWTLIEFVYEQIRDRRISSVNSVKALCDKYKSDINDIDLQKGAEFKSEIVYYFTSKYAPELSKLIKSDVEQSIIILKYLNEIYFETVVEDEKEIRKEGTELNNAKHLLGACVRLMGEGTNEVSLQILHAFSVFALEYSSNYNSFENVNKPTIKDALLEYETAFSMLIEQEDWDVCKKILDKISAGVKDLNPEIHPILKNLEAKFRYQYNIHILKGISDKFKIIE